MQNPVSGSTTQIFTQGVSMSGKCGSSMIQNVPQVSALATAGYGIAVI
jgi:hypothetical protein